MNDINIKKCCFCERADFGLWKTELNEYGAGIMFVGGFHRFPKEEQFKFCPECGRDLNKTVVKDADDKSKQS